MVDPVTIVMTGNESNSIAFVCPKTWRNTRLQNQQEHPCGVDEKQISSVPFTGSKPVYEEGGNV